MGNSQNMTATHNEWTEVMETIDTNNGIAVTTMGRLRDIAGYGRLGSTVRNNIANSLKAMGVGAITNGELPNDANANVILYRDESPAGELIDLITSIAYGGRATEVTANELRKLNGGSTDFTGVKKHLESALKLITR